MMGSLSQMPPALAPSAGGGGSRLRKVLVALAIALAAAAVIAYAVWRQGAERRALGSLPADERRALYLRTRQDLESVCVSPPEALRDHCRRQAELLSQFPECDAACRELVARLFPPQPAR
jgi:hypothetical protein